MSQIFMNSNSNNLYLSLGAVLIVILSFFILSALIMVTYNTVNNKICDPTKYIFFRNRHDSRKEDIKMMKYIINKL